MTDLSAVVMAMGLVAFGFFGAALGIAWIFSTTIATIGRQPESEPRLVKYMWIGFAMVEAIALYGLVVAFIIMGLRPH